MHSTECLQQKEVFNKKTLEVLHINCSKVQFYELFINETSKILFPIKFKICLQKE